ncbi:hypothetical protein LCGC14_1652980, partial [marine sediment metagenome]
MAQGFVRTEFGISAAALTGTILAPNVVVSSLEAVGALDTGSIVAGFTGIDGTPIGLGTPSTGAFTVFSALSGVIVFTATEDDAIALEIDVIGGGFADIKALGFSYITGAIGAGQDEAVLLVNFDQSAALGGDIAALAVVSTEGLAIAYVIAAGAGVAPIKHQSGVFEDMDSALVNAVDRLTEFTTAGTDIQMFVADNDTVTIGNATKFQNIEFLLAIVASGGGVAPTFEFSTGVGIWGSFTPVDGTNGMRNSGIIVWDDVDTPGWLVGTGSEFLIRITRTRNTLATPPTESLVQIAGVVQFGWNADG